MSDTAPTRMWTIGDYPTIARHLLPISEATVEALEVAPGMRVLDVAVGDGNAAVVAARRGAQVTGIDLTPAQIERAQRRCAAEGVAVELRVGDAQALDVADDSFDVVLSVMGLIFAPDPAAATAEVARVCRPGGRIGITAWTGGSWSAAWRARMEHLLPPLPPGPVPDDWGRPEVAVERLAAAGLEAQVEERPFAWRFPSVELALETFVGSAGPIMVFLEAMDTQGYGAEARSLLAEAIATEADVAADGTCTLSAPYLLIRATA